MFYNVVLASFGGYKEDQEFPDDDDRNKKISERDIRSSRATETPNFGFGSCRLFFSGTRAPRSGPGDLTERKFVFAAGIFSVVHLIDRNIKFSVKKNASSVLSCFG